MATYLPNVTDVFPEPALFTPDFSFMDKMLQRRKALYDQGFAQINSTYNFVNRETTNPYNAKVKEQFLKQAKDNLKNLSKMDLSQVQNVNAAKNVFAPFYNNFDVVGDQSLTEHWNRQVSIGNSYRLQEGGKFFHQNNIDYINQQKNYFANDGPESWKEYYGMKRSYTPYYDYKKEVAERMKEFKPSHTKTVKINGFYVEKVDDKSYLPGEISNYLDAVLSDQAKTQMRIDGAVKYGNNLDVLGKAYSDALAPVQAPLQMKILELDVDIRNEKDPTKKDQLIKERDAYANQKTQMDNNFSGTGDMTFVRRNAENLSFGIFYNEEIQRLAKGYAHFDVEQDVDFNQVAMMFYREAQETSRMYTKRNWELEDRKEDWEHELYKLGLKNNEGSLPYIPIKGGSSTPELNNFQGAKNDVYRMVNEVTTAQTELENHIKLSLPAGTVLTQKAFSKYVREHPQDELVLKFTKKSALYNVSVENLKNFKTNAQSFIVNNMGRKQFDALTILQTRLNKGMKLTDQETQLYNQLNTAYNTYLGKYQDPNYTKVATTYQSYGLNPADKRYAEAVSAAATMSGIDASQIGGGLIFSPTANGVDVSFNVQLDPNKSTISVTQLKASLEARVGKGNYQYNDKTGEVKILNAGAQSLQKFDPFYGFDYDQRRLLHRIGSKVYKGQPEEFLYLDRTKDGYNIKFSGVKAGENLYYLKNNKGEMITSGGPGFEPLKSVEDFGRTVKFLCENYTFKELQVLMNPPVQK
jgi:hypothetical protein